MFCTTSTAVPSDHLFIIMSMVHIYHKIFNDRAASFALIHDELANNNDDFTDNYAVIKRQHSFLKQILTDQNKGAVWTDPVVYVGEENLIRLVTQM